MELYLIKYFLAVVEAGSFTRAAKRVFVTQPTLSSGVKKLEDQLGQSLFERTNRRVFLTNAGTKFLPRAKAIMHECNMAMQVLSEDTASPVLRIGLLSTISPEIARKLFMSFRTEHPEVVITVFDGTEQELLNRTEDRSLDYALTLSRSKQPDHLIPLLTEGYKFVLAKDHPLVGKSIVTAQDLSDEHMVVRSRCEVLSETSRYFTDQNIRPRLIYRTNNDERAIAMVASGLGGTILPDCMTNNDRIAAFTLKGFDYQRTIALITPHFRMQDHTQAAAIDFENHAQNYQF